MYLRTNPSQEGEDDTILSFSRPLSSSLRPLTLSHNNELQGLQVMFSKRELLEFVFMPIKGYYILRIELGDKNDKEDNGIYYFRVDRDATARHLGNRPSLELCQEVQDIISLLKGDWMWEWLSHHLLTSPTR